MNHFDFTELNIWAVLAASVLNMVLGSLWYSRAVFGTIWMKLVGLDGKDVKPSPWLFIFSFLLGAIVAVFLGLFLQGVDGAGEGLLYGLVIAVVFIIPTLLTHYLYEMRKGKLMLIVAGHELILFAAYGAILGGWQ